jgi:hypothetical protein
MLPRSSPRRRTDIPRDRAGARRWPAVAAAAVACCALGSADAADAASRVTPQDWRGGLSLSRIPTGGVVGPGATGPGRTLPSFIGLCHAAPGCDLTAHAGLLDATGRHRTGVAIAAGAADQAALLDAADGASAGTVSQTTVTAGSGAGGGSIAVSGAVGGPPVGGPTAPAPAPAPAGTGGPSTTPSPATTATTATTTTLPPATTPAATTSTSTTATTSTTSTGTATTAAPPATTTTTPSAGSGSTSLPCTGDAAQIAVCSTAGAGLTAAVVAYAILRNGRNADGTLQPNVLQRQRLQYIDQVYSDENSTGAEYLQARTYAAQLGDQGISFGSFPRSFQAWLLGSEWAQSGRPFVDVGWPVDPPGVDAETQAMVQFDWYQVIVGVNSGDPQQWANAQALAAEVEQAGYTLPAAYGTWAAGQAPAPVAGGGDGDGNDGGGGDGDGGGGGRGQGGGDGGGALPLGGQGGALPIGGGNGFNIPGAGGGGYAGGPINRNPDGDGGAGAGGSQPVVVGGGGGDDDGHGAGGGDDGGGGGGGDDVPVDDGLPFFRGF